MMLKNESASFKDDAGKVFYFNNRVFRTVNNNYSEEYEYIKKKDIYNSLIEKKILINSWEVNKDIENEIKLNFNNLYKILEHEKLEYWSYPYEWTFSQLKKAAIFHLDFQLNLLENNISLKDASAYNVQFKNNKPVFIDTLSLQKFDENIPWQGHKQFCEEFLNPLVFSSKFNIPFNEIYKGNLNGISNHSIIRMLGYKIFLSYTLLINVYFTEFLSKSTKRSKKSKKVSYKQSQIFLINNLKKYISKLEYKKNKTAWSNYSSNNSYTKVSEIEKENILKKYLSKKIPHSVIDIGCNDGRYSTIAKDLHVKKVIALDFDMQCLERIDIESNGVITPMYGDLSNMSGGNGWGSKEKKSFVHRFKFDFSISFAVIHHLAISKNIPLNEILRFITSLSSRGLIEYIPLEDQMIRQMTEFRNKNYNDYNFHNFINILKQNCKYYEVNDLNESKRKIIYYE
jgi:ribosomal protein L11 methylase PrmA